MLLEYHYRGCISLRAVFWKYGRMTHILTDDQKRVQVRNAKQLHAKNVSKIQSKNKFSNIVTGDETWVHYFEPVRKWDIEYWQTKHCRRLVESC